MALRWEPKRPGETRDYRIDWSRFLGEDTILTSEVVAVGVTATGTIEVGNKSVKVDLAGGTGGTTARITNTIATAGGRTEIETVTIYISDHAEPVSLDDAKAHLRIVDDSSEDALIEGYILAARIWVENHTGHALVRREFTEQHTTDRGAITLYRTPVVSASVTYEIDGVVTPYSGVRFTSGYLFPPVGGTWPSLSYRQRFTVTYTAGYAEGEVPQPLIQAMLLLIGHWYANREAVVIGQSVADVPMAVESLVQQYRVPGI